MKTTAILVLLLFAIGASAQTENDTSLDNVTTMNTTNPTLIIPAPPIPEQSNITITFMNDTGITNETTTTSVTTTTIETPINVSTNETPAIENIIAPVPTTTITPTTTIAPVCGNMYQEIGEECDTTGSACGAGRWECIDCKCNRLPDETTTTTTIVLSTEFTLPDIGNASAIENIIPKGDNLFYLAVGAISVILIGLIVAYVLGKEKENATQETKLKWK